MKWDAWFFLRKRIVRNVRAYWASFLDTRLFCETSLLKNAWFFPLQCDPRLLLGKSYEKKFHCHCWESVVNMQVPTNALSLSKEVSVWIINLNSKLWNETFQMLFDGDGRSGVWCGNTSSNNWLANWIS